MRSDDLSRYDTLFEDYLVHISLTKTQAHLIDDALNEAISLFLSNYNDLDVYTQGSYAMGTIVKPLTANQSKSGVAGEYDVDIVLEREKWDDPTTALTDVRNILSDEYSDKVDKKNRESCERVYHSKDSNTDVQFHADYVPIKSVFNGAFRYVAHRSDNVWMESDTKKLKKWFLDFSKEHLFVQALIVMLKRVRDYAELTDVLPSICLTAIVCDGYRQSSSYAGDLITAVRKIVSVFSVPYSQMYIKMPTIDENLAERINANNCNKIRNVFQSFLFVLENEFIEKDVPDLNRIRMYLSDDFPGDLSNYPEFLESLRNRDLGIEFDGSLEFIDIEEENKNAFLMKRSRYKYHGRDSDLKFFVPDEDKSLYGIRWQVLNAEGSDVRRGNLFEAKGKSGIEGSSSNEFVNYEKETYDGLHWIRCFIYDKTTRKVVKIGRKFYVEVNL